MDTTAVVHMALDMCLAAEPQLARATRHWHGVHHQLGNGTQEGERLHTSPVALVKGAKIFYGHSGIWHLHYPGMSIWLTTTCPKTLIVTLGEVLESSNAKNRVDLTHSVCTRCGDEVLLGRDQDSLTPKYAQPKNPFGLIYSLN